jgi:hypothetical protein
MILTCQRLTICVQDEKTHVIVSHGHAERAAEQALLLLMLKRLRGRPVPSVTWLALLLGTKWRRSGDALRSGKRKVPLPLSGESGENVAFGSTVSLSTYSGE